MKKSLVVACFGTVALFAIFLAVCQEHSGYVVTYTPWKNGGIGIEFATSSALYYQGYSYGLVFPIPYRGRPTTFVFGSFKQVHL